MKNRMRVFALAFVALAATAGLSTLGYDEAQARPCCSQCEFSYNRCTQACNQDLACEGACLQRLTPCFRNCSIGC